MRDADASNLMAYIIVYFFELLCTVVLFPKISSLPIFLYVRRFFRENVAVSENNETRWHIFLWNSFDTVPSPGVLLRKVSEDRVYVEQNGMKQNGEA